MASIIVMKGSGRGDFHVLVPGPNIIGRSPALPISLADMTVSRHHLQILVDPDLPSFIAEDMGSTHGVLVNGIRLESGMVLTDGDCISVGRIDLTFSRQDVSSRAQAEAILESQQSELATLNFSGSAIRDSEVGPSGSQQQRILRFRAWAGAARTTLVIVFTDLDSSTAMNSALGNEAMNDRRRAHFARVRALIEEHGGCEIKTNGDGFMMAFRTAVRAVDFALDLGQDCGDPSLTVRIGAHIGPVVVEEEDVQGAAVSYAARLVDLATGGRIRLSAELKGHLDQEKASHHAGLAWNREGDITLKGFPGPQELWTVNGSEGSL